MDAYLALGYKCNHSCICCPLTTYDKLHAGFGKKEIDKKIEMILRAKKIGEQLSVTISGGEPFLNENLFHVLETFLELNVKITILTNSTLLSQDKVQYELSNLLNKYSKTNNIRIVSALHSSNNEKHDLITGYNGSFWKTVKGLEFAASLPISVTVKIIIHKMNYKDLVKTTSYIDEHFPMNVDIQFCGMDYSGRAEKNLKDLFVDFRAIQPYFEAAMDVIGEQNIKRSELNKRQRKVSVLELPLCMCDPYYWNSFVVPPDQRIVYLAPNSSSNGNETVYAESQCGTFYEECSNCKVNQFCYGTWNSTYKIKKDILKPIL